MTDPESVAPTADVAGLLDDLDRIGSEEGDILASASAQTIRAQAAALERERASHRQSVEIGHAFENDAKAQKARAEKAEAEARTAYARGLEDGAQIVSEKADEWWRLPFGDDFTATDLTDLSAAIRALAPDPSRSPADDKPR